MLYKNFYQNLTEEEIIKKIKVERFDPIKFYNGPEDTYPPHRHPETKLLAFIKGTMKLTAGGKTYHCKKGDKVIIPGNMEHSAIVGKDGCEFFWSEKLI